MRSTLVGTTRMENAGSLDRAYQHSTWPCSSWSLGQSTTTRPLAAANSRIDDAHLVVLIGEALDQAGGKRRLSAARGAAINQFVPYGGNDTGVL